MLNIFTTACLPHGYFGPTITRLSGQRLHLPYARVSLLILIFLPASTPLAAQRHQAVDVQSVRIEGDPSQWIHDIAIPAEPEEIDCDILVAGAGPGGVAAALRAAERGHTVCITEETDCIGGQLGTVSALDENRFIEFAGGTRVFKLESEQPEMKTSRRKDTKDTKRKEKITRS